MKDLRTFDLVPRKTKIARIVTAGIFLPLLAIVTYTFVARALYVKGMLKYDPVADEFLVEFFGGIDLGQNIGSLETKSSKWEYLGKGNFYIYEIYGLDSMSFEITGLSGYYKVSRVIARTKSKYPYNDNKKAFSELAETFHKRLERIPIHYLIEKDKQKTEIYLWHFEDHNFEMQKIFSDDSTSVRYMLYFANDELPFQILGNSNLYLIKDDNCVDVIPDRDLEHIIMQRFGKYALLD